MNRFFLVLSRAFIVGLVSLIVLAAVFVGLGRQFVSHIHEAQPAVEDYLSEQSGLIVSFNSINGSWEKLTPTVHLSGVQLKSPLKPDVFISVGDLNAEINLGASFLYFRPIIKLWIDQLVMELVYADGAFKLKHGPETAKDDAANNDDSGKSLLDQLDFILKQPHIQLSNSQISIKGFWAHDVTVSDINIGMGRKGGSKRFWADLVLSGASDIEMSLKGDISGYFSNSESLNGHIYGKIAAPDLAPWMPLPASKLTALEVSSAGGELDVWVAIAKGDLDRVTTQLNLSNVMIRKENSDIQPPILNHVVGTAKWQGDWSKDWVVGLKGFEIDGENFQWAPDRVLVHSKKISQDERHYIGEIDSATVSPWVRYFASFLDPASKSYQTLNQVKPEATLDNVLFSMEMINKEVADYRVVADVSNLTTQPKRWIPGVNNVKARALLGKYVSVIDILGEDVDLNYPALFRDPIVVDEVKGALLIHNTAEEWRVESGLLEINDQQLDGVTQLAVIKDKLSENSPYLRLQANLKNINATEDLYAHLPVGVIPKGVVDWIDGAVEKGRLMRGDLLFHGPTNLFEFEPFQYVLGFTLDDLQLRFLPDWKPVENIVADVRIYNGRVDAWALQGDYYGAQLDNAWISTSREENGDIGLTIDAALTGRAEEALQILVDSPIKETTGKIMNTIAVEGDTNIDLDIYVPFRKREPKTDSVSDKPKLSEEITQEVTAKKDSSLTNQAIPDETDVSELVNDKQDEPPLLLSVGVDLMNGQLDLVGNNLMINDLNGRVLYDLQKGLSASDLTGELFDGPLQATIETVYENVSIDSVDGETEQTSTREMHTIVTATGSTAMDKIKPWLKLDILDPLDGDFDYQAQVHIKPESEASDIARSFLKVESPLDNVSFSYPAPLNKQPETSLPFSYQTSLGGEKQFQKIALGELFELQTVSKEGVMQRGAIAFNQRAQLPNEQSFTISGSLDAFNVDDWLESYKRIEKAREGYGLEERSAALINEVGKSQLHINQLSIQEHEFSNLVLDFDQVENTITANMVGDQVDAMLQLPMSYLGSANYREISQPIDLNVKRLALVMEEEDLLPSLEPEENDKVLGVAVAEASQTQLDPRTLPALRIVLDNLQLSGKPFGSWQVTAIPAEDGVTFEQVGFDFRKVKFSGKGQWTWQGGSPKTTISGESKAKNVADVLAAWGYAKSLTSKSANAKVKGSWPGAPYEFSLFTAEAKSNVTIKDGRFRDVSSGAADKVLGFLNFDDWMSRMQLKIKDLDSNEMPFSSIRGNFDLKDEHLKTPDLTINSAAIKMAMKGDLNLRNQMIDANLDVTIPVTRNLVLPAAAVGGLPAAATVYVIEKVLGSQLDKLTTMKYIVEGPFGDPNVALKESFNIIPKQIQESIVKSGANNGSQSDLPDKGQAKAVNEAPTQTKPPIKKPANQETTNQESANGQ